MSDDFTDLFLLTICVFLLTRMQVKNNSYAQSIRWYNWKLSIKTILKIESDTFFKIIFLQMWLYMVMKKK